MEDIELLKSRLSSYNREQIQFNEPHFTVRLIAREGKREEVIAHLLHPKLLVKAYRSFGKYGDEIYDLSFAISKDRTLVLPAIFRKKSLYVITYVMRYRQWQDHLRR